MRKKRNNTIRVNPPKEAPSVGITTQKSETFFATFPFELKHKDGDESKTCWFSDETHMKKYINRYNLKTGSYTITNRTPNTKSL